MPKVSIILPIYNVEKYLPKALDSATNQTYKNIEIICINDCSPDNCLKILNEYSQKDNRIKIINHENNRGLSAARNTGLEIASGKYIYFLDSDDWIDEDYIEKMVRAIEKSVSDVVINRSVVTEKENNSIRYIHPHAETFITNNYLDKKQAIQNLIWNAWTKILKKSFIDKYQLLFPEGFVNEDLYFHYVSLAHADKIYLIDESNYHYRSRNSGISTNEKQKDLEILKIFDLIFDYYKKNDLLDKGIKIFSVMPFFTINNANKYKIYREYFKKTSNYILENNKIYNDIDLYFTKTIMNTKNYEEYCSKYSSNVTLEYLKNRRINHGI